MFEYYTSGGKKVADFCLGFFGVVVIYVIFVVVYFILMWLMSLLSTSLTGDLSNIVSMIIAFTSYLIWILPFILCMVLMVMSFRRQRRFIGIGIATSIVTGTIVIPFLFLGACFLALASYGAM